MAMLVLVMYRLLHRYYILYIPYSIYGYYEQQLVTVGGLV